MKFAPTILSGEPPRCAPAAEGFSWDVYGLGAKRELLERSDWSAGPDRYPTIPKACPHAAIGTHPSIQISQHGCGFFRPESGSCRVMT
jgi:hypothetical protein